MTETSPCEFIVGFDTHKDTHAAVAINTWAHAWER